MRGIERVIAGVLLAAAVCGSAAFARSVGRDAIGSEPGVQLTAAPPQHGRSPRGVQVPLYALVTDHPAREAATRSLAKPRLAGTPLSTPSPAVPAHPVVAAPAAVRRPPLRRISRPKIPSPLPKPAPKQSEARLLARAPLTPTPTPALAAPHVKAVGHGRPKSRPDEETAPEPTPQTTPGITVVVLPPAPPAAPGAADRPGKGHAYGHLKHRVNDHD